MICKFVEKDGLATETLIEIEEFSISMINDCLEAYKNIAENPTINGWVEYLRMRGAIVETVEPVVFVL